MLGNQPARVAVRRNGTETQRLFWLALFSLATPLAATTLLPLSDQELRARSTVIVEGVVVGVAPFESSRGLPETQATIRPLQVFRGQLSGDLVVRDRGGMLPDGRWLKVFGRPEYVVGRRVLVFAIPHPDGGFQTAEFTLGKFEVWKDSTGRRFLARDLLTRSRDGVLYLGASPSPASDTLRDYHSFVRMLRSPRSEFEPAVAHPNGSLVPEAESSGAGLQPMWANWGSSTRYRWPNGASVSWTLSSTASLLTGGGYSEARSALASWTNHSQSSIGYRDGGLGSSGTNFLDIASLSVCGTSGPFCGGGVIGCGGPGGASGSHSWREDNYSSISWAHVEIRQLTSPTCVTTGVFAAAVTHELGHTLGFGHSDHGASPRDACRGDEHLAQMRSSVQSRGTSLGTDDSDAARWVYGDGLTSCGNSPDNPTPTPTATPTAPATATSTPTPVAPTPTRTPTATPTRTPTATPTGGPPGATPTPTSVPPAATQTPVPPPPTPTRTPPPTWTPAPPEATGTPTQPTAIPTSTPTPAAPTATPVPPSQPSATPTPQPSAPVRANFGWTPTFPRAGEPVYFHDLSTGSPYRWIWKLGSSETSSSQNPTHVFSKAGIVTVTLTVTGFDGRSTRRQKVTVSTAAAEVESGGSRTVPVAGHVRGLGDRTFLTDVQIENPSDVAATARLSFEQRDGEAPPAISLDLAAHETRNFSDAVLALFGLSDSLGALRLDWESGPPSGLRMTSRTYTRSAEGTFGHAAAGFRDSDEPRASRFVTGIVRTDLFRTNLGAVNDTREFTSFQILLRERSGEVIGESAVLGLPPGRQTQIALADLFPAAEGNGMTAEVRPVGGSAAPFAYAAVVDNITGDPTFYPAARPASSRYLPGVARVTGYDRTFFSSDVSIANAGDEAARVEVSFLEHDRDNSRAPAVSLWLEPRETIQLDDALGTLFGLSETYGALAIESLDPSARLVVAERISARSPGRAGTAGQQVDALPDEGFFSRGSILGLREDEDFRSNVGFFNPEPFEATVSVVLRRADGAVIGETTITVPPLGYVQRNLGLLFGEALPQGEPLTLSLDSGSIDIFAFATIIDNVSQDPTFSPGLD